MNQSMLHVAASFSQLGMLSVLLKAGADSRATDSKGCTPLHLIGKCRGDNRADSVEIAFCLIESGASTTCRDAEGRQPLEEALYRSNVMLALVILEGKRHSKPRTFQEQGPILLHKAVRLGYLGAVNELVKEGFNMNTQDESGLTPLLTAVIRGHCDIVEVLLRHRVYTTVFTAGGQTALHIAIDRSRLDIISVLLRGGALTSIRNAQGFTALYHAVRQGRGIGEATVVQALLNGGASVCEGGIKRLTALHLAVQAGHTKCVRLLLDAGATPGHCRNEEGVSPLFLAIRQGYTPIANLLIPRLTDRQIEMHHTNSGNTALTLAIHKQHREVVREVRVHAVSANGPSISRNGHDWQVVLHFNVVRLITYDTRCTSCFVSPPCTTASLRRMIPVGATISPHSVHSSVSSGSRGREREEESRADSYSSANKPGFRGIFVHELHHFTVRITRTYPRVMRAILKIYMILRSMIITLRFTCTGFRSAISINCSKRCVYCRYVFWHNCRPLTLPCTTVDLIIYAVA